jgi:hypothetical protein
VVALLTALASRDPGERLLPERAPEEPSLTAAAAPASVWRPIVSPTPLFALDWPGEPPAILSARRHSSGAREDSLAVGAFDRTDGRHLHLIVGRATPENGASLFVEIARRAAEAGLSAARVALKPDLESKFGTLEAAEAVLASAAEIRACLVFRFADRDSGFRFAGWFCDRAADARSGDGQDLACALDRLTLRSAEDPLLNVLFAQAERRRICPAPSRPAIAELDRGGAASAKPRAKR